MDKRKHQARAKGAAAPGTGRGRTRAPKPETVTETVTVDTTVGNESAELKSPTVVAGGLPKLPTIKRENRSSGKPKPTRPCICGCDTPTKGQWAPGHDSRAKGWAIRVERGIVKMSDIPANEQAGAKFMIKARKDEGGVHGKAGTIRLHKGKTTEAAEPVAEQVSDPAVGQ